MALSPSVYQFLVAMFASIGSLLYGYDLGVMAEVVAAPSFSADFNQPDSTSTGLVVSMFTTGAFFGAFGAGYTGDKFGRGYTILMGSLIFIFGGGLQTGARTIHYLWAGRFIAGLGVGFLVMIVPLYQAELAHPSIRGRITSLQQLMLGVGSLIAAWVSYGTYVGFPDTNDAQWRIALGLQIAPAIVLAALILLFPESPRWLIDQGRTSEGLHVLAKLHAHGDENDDWVRAEHMAITETITYEKEHEAKSLVELVRSYSAARRLVLAIALQASAQMTGVSAIQYYSVDIYAQMGINGADTLKYQGFNSIVALIAQFLCLLLIDKFGRRWTLICGNLTNMATFIIATALLAVFNPQSGNASDGAEWAFIIMTWCYNFSYSCTVGPLTWIIPAEIFDTHTRNKGVSIATMTSFAFNTMISQVSPLALEVIGWRYYLVFVVCNATNALFFWAFLPETKRRPLEEMNALFEHMPLFVAGRSNTPVTALVSDVEAPEKVEATKHIEVEKARL